MKQHIGMTAIVVGIIGAMAGAGGVETSVANSELVASLGVAVVSCMLMYAGVQLVKDSV